MAMEKTARTLESERSAFESHPSRCNLGLDLTSLSLSSLIHIMKVTIPASWNGVKEMTGNMPVTGGSSYPLIARSGATLGGRVTREREGPRECLFSLVCPQWMRLKSTCVDIGTHWVVPFGSLVQGGGCYTFQDPIVWILKL